MISLSFDGYEGQTSFPLVQIDIGDGSSLMSEIPDKLSVLNLHAVENAFNRSFPRAFTLSMGPGMVWTLNGRTFEMEGVARDEIVKLNDLEVWEFENRSGSGMGMMGSMSLPHPMHIHGLQFQVIERKMSSADEDRWNFLRNGIVDEGWHDTVLVFPGERVKILLVFIYTTAIIWSMRIWV